MPLTQTRFALIARRVSDRESPVLLLINLSRRNPDCHPVMKEQMQWEVLTLSRHSIPRPGRG